MPRQGDGVGIGRMGRHSRPGRRALAWIMRGAAIHGTFGRSARDRYGRTCIAGGAEAVAEAKKQLAEVGEAAVQAPRPHRAGRLHPALRHRQGIVAAGALGVGAVAQHSSVGFRRRRSPVVARTIQRRAGALDRGAGPAKASRRTRIMARTWYT